MKVSRKNRMKVYAAIRQQYGSVTAFAKALGVSRINVYHAINGTKKYLGLLKAKIETSLKDKR